MIAWLKDIPRQYRFAPRVDNASIVLTNGPTGEAQMAKINDSLMKNAEVMVWQRSGVTNRPITTGVTATQLGYVNVTPGAGTASKALVLNSSKDLAGVRNLQVTKIEAQGGNIRNFAADNLTVGSVLEALEFKLNGLMTSDLVLNTTFKIKSIRSAVKYDVVARDGAVLRFGNTTDSLQLATGATTDLLHRKGTTNYKIWDAGNHGHNSGLNADLLDGVHAAQFVRADTTSEITGTLRFLNSLRFSHSALGATDAWRIDVAHSAYHFSIFSVQANKTVLQLNRDGGSANFSVNALRVNNNDVMHKGNDGAGSGFDADLLDGQHGSYYRQESSILGAMGTGALTRKSYVDGMFAVTASVAYTNYNARSLYVTTTQFGKLVVVNARFISTTQTNGALIFNFSSVVSTPNRDVFCSSVTSKGGKGVFYVKANTRSVYLYQGETGSYDGDVHAVTFTYIVT